jgi:uncharacterized protein (TIGR03067 family)
LACLRKDASLSRDGAYASCHRKADRGCHLQPNSQEFGCDADRAYTNRLSHMGVNRMKRMVFSMAIAVFVGGLGLRAAEVADDKKILQGKWMLAQMDKESKLQDIAKTSEEFFHMTFSGDKVATEFAEGKEEGTYKIDPAQKVKTIDVTAATSDDKGKVFLGIYSLDGDTLTLAMAEPGVKKRPTEFKGKKDEITVYVLKRVK